MKSIPLNLDEAGDYVKKHHRHNDPPTRSKFAIGAVKEGQLVGVAIAGRPIARLLNDGKTLEIIRVCTDGTFNANSFLYSRVKKIALLMGYEKVITYTLQEESGASLKAIGAQIEAEVQPGKWNRKGRPRRNQEVYSKLKWRWKL
jgi:hypothetical protein